MDFIIPTLTATAATLKIAESRGILEKKTKMIKKFLFNGKLNIVVLGCGGIGKTTLGYILTNEPSKISTVYNETRTIKKLKVGNDIIGNFWIAPGQKTRIDQYWPHLYDLINANKVQGLIYLCSYGYHSIADIDNYKQTKYYKKGMTKAKFLEVYFKKKRNEEIKILKTLKTRIIDTKKPIWMCTLVTKQDLWWKDHSNVQKHYTKGAYSRVIKEIKRQKGEKNFTHEYLSTSLIINNLKFGKTIMAKTVSGYDEQIRMPHQDQLVNFVTEKVIE